MKTVVITGVTGAVGMALIQQCIKEKTRVIILARKDSKRVSRIVDNRLVDILYCNLEDYALLANKLEHYRDYKENPTVIGETDNPGEVSSYLNSTIAALATVDSVDVFYHLAWKGTTGEARNDMQLQNDNVKYALDAVELARTLKAKCFIGAGSQAEYGRIEGVLTAETPTYPENGYGMAKLCAGQMTRVLCDKYGINQIWVRILSVYGPYDNEKSMIISTIRKLLNGEIPALTRGEQKWDYLYSGDAARALYLLGSRGSTDASMAGQIFCLGNGRAERLSEYIKTIRDLINPRLELGFGVVPYSDKQVMYLQADSSKLTETIGNYATTSFEDGIRNTIKWVKEN